MSALLLQRLLLQRAELGSYYGPQIALTKEICVVKFTGRVLVVKRQVVLSKVLSLDLVLAVWCLFTFSNGGLSEIRGHLLFL